MADSGPTAAASVAQSSIAVPGWAIATAASNIGETASPQSGPGQGTGAVSLEDSQRTYTNSNPTSDQKVARPSAMRNIAVLPLESASGARSRPSANQRLPEHDIEKGSFKLANTESKVSKRTPTNCSPLNSRQQSVVPELPPEWQVAAGIKNSGVSDSTSSCCGRIRSTDGSGTKGATVCSRKRWRACAHSVILEFKKVIEVVHTKPLVLLPGIAVLAIVLGLGLWALIAASSAEERFRHDSATKIATDKALYIQTELDKTFMPAYVVATAVQQDPNYYPTQPANLNQVYKNQWYLVNKKFDKLAGDLIALTKAGSVRTVSAIPHGVIRTMYPLNGTELAHDRNWGAIGKNWLNDSVNAAPVKVSLQSHNLTIIGPYNLVQGGIGIVGMQSIFVNATREDTFGIPPGPNNATGPTSSIPGMLDLTWQPSNGNAPRFWGLVTVLLSWDFLRDNVTNLQDLSAQGYDYVLTRPDKNNTNLAVDWSPGIDPPRPPGFNVSSSGSRPLIYYDLPSALQDPVIVKVPLPNVEWTLYVSRTGGWVPSWKAPLIAMVVILSFVLSLLVFAVLVSRVQQRRLLRDVVEAAGKLASTTRILEDEKNRMQALLARHFDLIDLLEGGAGGLAGSLQGAGGGGAAASGDGARSRIDILRQKMLLTGTSLRREQLGEAEQVTIQEMLGEGTFGKVYKGLWRGTEVAIKTIVLPANMSGKEKREKMAVMEAAISSSLAHPNIVQTYTYHIRPLRDSSVTPCLPPPSPQRTAATPAAAGGGGSGEASGGAAAGAATAAATAAVAASGDGVGRTQILADVGAIVVGSPDSSVSTTSVSVHNCTNNASGAAAAASAAAAVAGVGAASAAAPPPPEATAPASGTTGGVLHSVVGPRGVSMDQPQSATAGVHSYEVQLVLEYCDRGCLRDALDAGAFFSANGLNYPAILETAADIAKAMLHLHLNDVLHSDLKATNVMLKSTGGSESGRGVIAKVADFGLSVRLDPTATHMSHAFQGSLTHMAPEVMLQGHISRPADVYAFGITLWEIFTGGQAYRGTPGALLGHQTSKEGRRPVFPAGTPRAYRELAERCWHAVAANRPTFSEILDLLNKMRSEIPGPTTPLQPFTPLNKKMAEALAQEQQQQQHPRQPYPHHQQQHHHHHNEQNGNGHAHGGAGDGGYSNGLGFGGGGDGGGIIIGGGGGSGSSFGVGASGAGGSGIAPLHKIGGPAAIVVGGRLVSLNAAIHSVESNGGRMMLGGNIAAAGASLGGLGLPGVLETINEEGMGDVSAALPPAPAAAAAAAAGAAGAGVAVEALHRNVTQQQQQQQQMDEGGWAGGGLAPAAVTVAVSREVKVGEEGEV